VNEEHFVVEIGKIYDCYVLGLVETEKENSFSD